MYALYYSRYIMKRNIGFILILALFTSCSVCKQVQSHPIASIHFGSGGGFAGAKQSYALYKDGTLVHQGDTIVTLPCDTVLTLFQQAQQFTTEYVKPGNTYNFLRITYQNGDTYNYTWKFGDIFNTDVLLFYQRLKAL